METKDLQSTQSKPKNLSADEYNKMYWKTRQYVLQNMKNSYETDLGDYKRTSAATSFSNISFEDGETNDTKIGENLRQMPSKDKRLSASLPTLNTSQRICASRRSMASEGDVVGEPSARDRRLKKMRLQALRGQVQWPGVASGWRLVEMYENRPVVDDEQFDLAAIMSKLCRGRRATSRRRATATTSAECQPKSAPRDHRVTH